MDAHRSWLPREKPDIDVAILGTGFSGLGMAIALKKAGRSSFQIFEKAHDVGGTWRDNHYPGCACDVPSHLYSFSFEPNPNWSRMYSPQPEILGYLKRCADKYDLYPSISFNAEVTRAVFDEAHNFWRIETKDGQRITARALVSGMGGLSRPAYPDIKGLKDFSGAVFHSADWNHDYDLTGKTVAVIGTGASAIQFVPQIAPEVKQLHLFQRTPPWIVPKLDRPIRPWEHKLFHAFPILQYLMRGAIYCRMESGVLGFTVNPKLMKKVEQIARDHLTDQVPDEELRKILTPTYLPGCKRILISNDYYPALGRDNVNVVTAEISEIRGTVVVTKDGAERPVDAIILGTGFKAMDVLTPTEIIGREGRSLAQEWGDFPKAHLGITVSGYPNLFFLMGPNTGLGHNSMVYMIESQIHYVMDALAHMDKRQVPALDVLPKAQAEFNEEIQARIGKTVWQTGCKSWYQRDDGRNPSVWPSFTFSYRRRTRRIDPLDYEEVA